MSASSDPPIRTLSLLGGPLAYTDESDEGDEGEGAEGARPSIVLVHGLPGSHRDFRYLAPHLRGRARVLRLDLPGFGGSAPLCPFERGPLAELILRLCDALSIDRFTVASHSFASQIALKLAVRAPDRVQALALIAPVGAQKHRGAAALPAGLFRRGLERRVTARLLRPALRRIFLAAGFSASPPLEEIERSVRILSRWRFAENARLARAVQAPVLAAWSQDDPVVQPEIVRALLSLCPPGPRLRFLEGGHNLQKTKAAPIAEAVLDLIETLPPWRAS